MFPWVAGVIPELVFIGRMEDGGSQMMEVGNEKSIPGTCGNSSET